MIKEIRMPAGGQTTDVSVVGAWLKKCGDKVERGDALLEIETDKATLTVESYAKGTVLALLAEEGDKVPAGEVIALIGDESDRKEAQERAAGENAAGDVAKSRRAENGTCPQDRCAEEFYPELRKSTAAGQQESAVPGEEEYQPIDKSSPRRMKTNPVAVNATPLKQAVGNTGRDTTKTESARIKAMPNAKLLAKENQISLADVAQAAGKSILKRQDVAAYLEKSNSSVTVPFTNMRKIIARRMTESAQNIPAFTAAVEIDMTQCIAFRKLINSSGDGKKVSYNDILFKCIEAAARSYPKVNASCNGTGIILHKDINIGLAVSVEGGLVVPVVHKVQEKNIAGISACNRENVEKARSGKLMPDDMSGGTITLSNLGMYPVRQFTAIINPPEVCILAVGAIEEKVVFADGEFKAVPVMTVTGSFDHRVIDGAYGAGFLAELKKIIENPALALV